MPVDTLFEYLEDGAPLEEFLTQFPYVSREHAVAVIKLAARKIRSDIVQDAA